MFATVSLLIAGCAGLAQRSSDASAIRTAVARHLILEAVPARLGSEILPYCLGLGSLTDASAPADPDDEVIAGLRADGMEVQPVTTCELPVGAPGPVTDRSTGERRVLLLIAEEESRMPEDGFVEAQYYHGGTAAAFWRCAVEDQAGEWAVGWCKLIWES